MKLFLLACMVAVAAAEEQLAAGEQYYYPSQPYPYIQERQGLGANAAVSLPFVDANAGLNTQGANAGLSLPFADANVGLSGQGANANFNLKNPISSFNPVDLTSYAPSNIITTMVYALGILSLVNLLLGLIPVADDEPEVEAVAAAGSNKEGRSMVQPLANTVYQAISTLAEKYGEFQQL